MDSRIFFFCVMPRDVVFGRPACHETQEMELVEVPNTRSLKERVGQTEKQSKFYGVRLSESSEGFNMATTSY